MMTALATVSSVEQSGQQYFVQLSCEQQTSCSSCSSQKSCGTGIVTKAVGNKSLFWQLKTKSLVKAGQIVEIGFPEKSLLQSAAIVYLIPLFMLMIGAGFGQLLLQPLLQGGEGTVILSAALFTAGGIALAKLLAKPMEDKSKQEVVLIRILGEPLV
ncbi:MULTISPECIES: SoxR reducing system RseC family protein [Vibrio]|uniref:Transcriptional regulator n=1 Tax=Vibrio splendidus TaxID=29497 RepID=A0A7Y4G1K7_VIBSP|nr:MULTISPECIES: SoxR reducing system RseC family protein [Vibrio]NOJ14867.1 transcriptional regulator [Vibrio splendidus]UQV21226.1 SoxR reducing system RseC family protein [Vibrio sp. J383]